MVYLKLNDTLGRTEGVITSNVVSVQSSSLSSTPPTITLAGVTTGGPPTTYTWRRNGVEITDEDSISIAVTEDTDANRQISGYTSTLVTSLPGLYQYSVSNRAMITPHTGSIGIQGNFNLSILLMAQGTD